MKKLLTYPVSQFLIDEWLKNCKEHVKNIWLVQNLDSLQSNWDAILKKKNGLTM